MIFCHQCEADVDCPGGSFCELSNICEICVPCEKLFNRLPSDQKDCARSEDDCGPCLNGYQAEDHTVQRRSFKCYSSADENAASDITVRSGIPWNSFVATAAAVVLLAALLMAFATYHYKKRKSFYKSLLDFDIL